MKNALLIVLAFALGGGAVWYFTKESAGGAGASPVAALERMIAEAGFERVEVAVKGQSRELVEEWSPGSGAADAVASALIEAAKPA